MRIPIAGHFMTPWEKSKGVYNFYFEIENWTSSYFKTVTIKLTGQFKQFKYIKKNQHDISKVLSPYSFLFDLR